MPNLIVQPRSIMGLDFYEIAPGEWRVRDVELGRWLGMAKPTNIRQTIRSFIASGILNDSDVARITADGGGAVSRPVEEFLLGDEAAIVMATRSETSKGKRFGRQIARMFLSLESASRTVEELKALCFTREISNREEKLFIKLLELLAEARGEDPKAHSYPWGPWIGQIVYACAEGHVGELQKFRREINPECRHRDYNHMTEKQQQHFRTVLAVAEAFAGVCVKRGEGLDEWRNMLLSQYLKTPLQLTMADNDRRLLAVAKTAKRSKKPRRTK